VPHLQAYNTTPYGSSDRYPSRATTFRRTEQNNCKTNLRLSAGGNDPPAIWWHTSSLFCTLSLFSSGHVLRPHPTPQPTVLLPHLARHQRLGYISSVECIANPIQNNICRCRTWVCRGGNFTTSCSPYITVTAGLQKTSAAVARCSRHLR
jgi:hypothetical protein